MPGEAATANHTPHRATRHGQRTVCAPAYGVFIVPQAALNNGDRILNATHFLGTRSLLVAFAATTLWIVGQSVTSHSAAAENRQMAPANCYSRWARHPAASEECFYSVYYYQRPYSNCIQFNFMVWYPSDPTHCYMYDPQQEAYWGRWNYEDESVTFGKYLEADELTFTFTLRLERGRLPKQCKFDGRTTNAGEAPVHPAAQAPMAFPVALPPA